MVSHGEVTIPAWSIEDFQWEHVACSFEFRVDNLPLAQWISGEAEVDHPGLGPRVQGMLEHLLSIV
eukprot:8089440-Karenia_brevis.AAC.1